MRNRSTHPSLGPFNPSSSGISRVLFLAAGVLSACATLHSPVSQSNDKPTAALAVSVDAVTNRAYELRIKSVRDVPITLLEIYRAEPDTDFVLLDEVLVTPEVQTALYTTGLIYRDKAQTNRNVAFRVVGLGAIDPVVAAVEVPTVAAPKPPKLTAQMTEYGVLLSWSPRADGVAIFRRDVLRPKSKLVRIDVEGAKKHLDRETVSDGVYAYRITAATKQLGWPKFGSVSDEVFVAGNE